MGRHNRRTVASFVTAAAVLAVLFAAFFMVSDILPIPDDFREIIGLASADTTDVGELATGSDAATSTADPLTSLDTSSTSGAGSSAETSTTPAPSSDSQDPDTASDSDGPLSGAASDSDGTTADEPPSSGVAPADSAGAPVGVTVSGAPSIQAVDTTPPVFPEGAILAFRYPTPSGFTVGYTRASDVGSGVDYYHLLIEQIQGLGSETVLSSIEASTTSDEYAASGLAAGAYRVSVTAVDVELNRSDPLVGEVLVGHDRPQVQITFVDPSVQAAMQAGGWINWGTNIQLAVIVHTEAPSYKIISTDLIGAASVTASIESSPTTSTVISIGGEGQRQVSVSAVDCYDLDSAPTLLNFKVDRTAPTSVTLLRARQPLGTTELRVSWARSLDLTSGISHYVIEVTDEDGEVVRRVRRSYLTNPYYRFTDLDFGYYRITVTPVDIAGNEGVSSRIGAALSEQTAKGYRSTSGTTWSGSSGNGAGSGSGGGSGEDADGDTPAVEPKTPDTPADEPTDSGAAPRPPIDTKINGSNRLYWLIGAVGLGLGLLMIYFTAVYRAFSKKES